MLIKVIFNNFGVHLRSGVVLFNDLGVHLRSGVERYGDRTLNSVVVFKITLMWLLPQEVVGVEHLILYLFFELQVALHVLELR